MAASPGLDMVFVRFLGDRRGEVTVEVAPSAVSAWPSWLLIAEALEDAAPVALIPAALRVGRGLPLLLLRDICVFTDQMLYVFLFSNFYRRGTKRPLTVARRGEPYYPKIVLGFARRGG